MTTILHAYQISLEFIEVNNIIKSLNDMLMTLANAFELGAVAYTGV